MSTPSKIILKIREEDKGKKVKFSTFGLPIPYMEWIDRDHDGKVWINDVADCICEEVTLDGDYIGIYCHWDGYPSNVGKVLRQKFKTYDAILNLIVGGFASSICNGLKHYANRKGEEWKDNKPIQGSLEKVESKIYGQFEYVFENDKWTTKKC